jgi:hypothetical protein
LRYHVITLRRAAVNRRRSFNACLDVVAFKPVIGIKQTNPIVFLGDCNQRTYPPRGVAVIAMSPIKL